MSFKGASDRAQKKLRRPTQLVQSGMDKELTVHQKYDILKDRFNSLQSQREFYANIGDKASLKQVGQQIWEVNQELALISKQVKWQNRAERPLNYFLLDVIREKVPQTQFAEWMRMAKGRADAEAKKIEQEKAEARLNGELID